MSKSVLSKSVKKEIKKQQVVEEEEEEQIEEVEQPIEEDAEVVYDDESVGDQEEEVAEEEEQQFEFDGEVVPEKPSDQKKLLMHLLGIKRPPTFMQLWSRGPITEELKQEVANNAPLPTRRAAFESARAEDTGKVNLGKYRNAVWKALPDADKKPYQDEYNRLVAEWQDSVKSASEILPKRAVKPYYRFLSEHTAVVTAKNPAATAADVSKSAGAEWEKIKASDAIKAYTDRYTLELQEAEESLQLFRNELLRLYAEHERIAAEAEQEKQERAALALEERKRKAALKRAEQKAAKLAAAAAAADAEAVAAADPTDAAAAEEAVAEEVVYEDTEPAAVEKPPKISIPPVGKIAKKVKTGAAAVERSDSSSISEKKRPAPVMQSSADTGAKKKAKLVLPAKAK
jgi:hypothetical protein